MNEIRKTTIILFLLISALISACNQGTKAQAEAPAAEKAHHITAQQDAWEKNIKLNKGSQWQANKATTDGIVAMSTIIKNTTPSSTEDYQQLGTALKEETTNILSKSIAR